MRVLVTGGGGFVGSHLVERLERGGDDVFVARRRDYDLTRWDDAERLFADASPSWSSTWRPRSAGSARTAPTRAATGTRT